MIRVSFYIPNSNVCCFIYESSPRILGLEKTIMQGMVAELFGKKNFAAGKRSRGKPRQRWEKYITCTFGTMAAASRVAEDRHQFRSRDIWAATSWRGYAPRRRYYVFHFSPHVPYLTLLPCCIFGHHCTPATL